MKRITSKRNLCLLAALLIGMTLLLGGLRLLVTMTGQAGYYNAGLQSYQKGDLPHAVQFFDKSIAAYKAGKTAGWWHRFIYPQPSDEIAAQANFQKGKAMLQAQQAEQAVDAFKESLRLNPGNRTDGLNMDDATRLHEEAMVVKYDLEMLFKSRPDLAQQQGKGQGKGKGQGQPQQAPGQQPGNQPGKGNRDDI